MNEIVTLKLSEIIPYERNPRKNDAAVDDVAESIRQCGYKAKIIVDENNVIIAGHTRLKALKKLGWKQAEVQRELDMTEQQKKKYRLLDNKVSEKSEWDFDLLQWELEDIDFEGYDFDFDIGEDLPEEEEERENIYTDVINIPQYTPKNECPAISDLCDLTKYKELIAEISDSNIDEDTKVFLELAAARHIGFNYKLIADYYAHQDADTQRLMENSALVIIDVENAIRNGFAKLKSRLDEIEELDDEE